MSEGAARLTVQQLGYLQTAGRWGLLRPQSGRRFKLTGDFSMPAHDLMRVLAAAGGRDASHELIHEGAVDVLVAGDRPSAVLTEQAYEAMVPVWDEAELVANLLPTLSSLTAPPGVLPD